MEAIINSFSSSTHFFNIFFFKKNITVHNKTLQLTKEFDTIIGHNPLIQPLKHLAPTPHLKASSLSFCSLNSCSMRDSDTGGGTFLSTGGGNTCIFTGDTRLIGVAKLVTFPLGIRLSGVNPVGVFGGLDDLGVVGIGGGAES